MATAIHIPPPAKGTACRATQRLCLAYLVGGVSQPARAQKKGLRRAGIEPAAPVLLSCYL